MAIWKETRSAFVLLASQIISANLARIEFDPIDGISKGFHLYHDEKEDSRYDKLTTRIHLHPLVPLSYERVEMVITEQGRTILNVLSRKRDQGGIDIR